MLNFRQKEYILKKYLDIFKKCSLFTDIADADLLVMLDCFKSKIVTFDKKYTILMEGAPAKYICILLSGSAQVIGIDFYGNRNIVNEITPAEIFGESFACSETPQLPISVIANEPCEVMFIESDHILHTCKNSCSFHRQIIYNLMKGLATKNLKLHQKIEITSKRTTREKLIAYLSLQSKIVKSKSFDIPFDRQELADYLEVDRTGLSAEISKLKKEGYIDCKKNHFLLYDLQKMPAPICRMWAFKL